MVDARQRRRGAATGPGCVVPSGARRSAERPGRTSGRPRRPVRPRRSRRAWARRAAAASAGLFLPVLGGLLVAEVLLAQVTLALGVPDLLQHRGSRLRPRGGPRPRPGRERSSRFDRAEAVVAMPDRARVGQVAGGRRRRAWRRRRGGSACGPPPRASPSSRRSWPSRPRWPSTSRAPASISRRLSSIRPCALYSSEFFSPARRPCSVSPSSRRALRSGFGVAARPPTARR